MAKGSYVIGQHGRLDSEIQNLQGRTEKIYTADTYITVSVSTHRKEVLYKKS